MAQGKCVEFTSCSWSSPFLHQQKPQRAFPRWCREKNSGAFFMITVDVSPSWTVISTLSLENEEWNSGDYLWSSLLILEEWNLVTWLAVPALDVDMTKLECACVCVCVCVCAHVFECLSDFVGFFQSVWTFLVCKHCIVLKHYWLLFPAGTKRSVVGVHALVSWHT